MLFLRVGNPPEMRLFLLSAGTTIASRPTSSPRMTLPPNTPPPEEMRVKPCLAVDLDGTLTPCDTLWESLVAVAQAKPSRLPRILLGLAGGVAKFKENLAVESAGIFSPSRLPWSEEVLGVIASAKSEGREIILVTGADREMAERVAAHLGVFDQVMGSDGKVNLVGGEKSLALVKICGPGGFDYIGNDRVDLPVWSSCGVPMSVGGGGAAGLRRQASRRGVDLRLLGPVTSRTRTWFRALRVGQWAKNLLVFAPMLAAHNFLDLGKWAAGAVCAACFCLCASGAYLLNDILDREHDRSHPHKRIRPIAAGELQLPVAMCASVLLPCAGLALSWSLGALPGLAFYYFLTVLYSLRLRGIVIIDILTLACLYCLRIFVGGQVTAVPVSMWMAAFGGVLFVSLAAAKRYAELWNLRTCPLSYPPTPKSGPGPRGRGYGQGDMDLLKIIGVSTACMAPLILILYLLDEKSKILYNRPDMLMIASALIFAWAGTLWRDTLSGLLREEDPMRHLLSSPRSLCLLALFVAVVLLATGGV